MPPTATDALSAETEAAIDALLDETAAQGEASAAAVSAADPDPSEPEQRAPVRTEPSEADDRAAAKGHEGEDGIEAAPEPGAPDPAEEPDEDATTVAASPAPVPSVEDLTTVIGQQRALLQQIAAAETGRQQQDALAKAEADYTAFMASLEEMDPEDAANAKLSKVMEFAAGMLKRQQAQEYQATYTAQKQETVDFIAAGGRVRLVDGVWRKLPTVAKPLPAEEVAVLLDFDGPQAMERYADRVLSQRTQQTAAARAALAESRREAGEGLAGGGAGSRNAPPQSEEPTTLDELFDLQDQVYGGSPYALRQQAAGLSP